MSEVRGRVLADTFRKVPKPMVQWICTIMPILILAEGVVPFAWLQLQPRSIDQGVPIDVVLNTGQCC